MTNLNSREWILTVMQVVGLLVLVAVGAELLAAALGVLQAGVTDQSLFTLDYAGYEGLRELPNPPGSHPLGFRRSMFKDLSSAMLSSASRHR